MIAKYFNLITIFFLSAIVSFKAISEIRKYPIDAVIRMELNGAELYVYDPPYKAKRIYKDIAEVGNLTIEELFESIASESSQEWVDMNYDLKMNYKVTADQFEARKNRDPDSNYYELIHRVNFIFEGFPTAVIKYWFVEDGHRSIIAGATVQKRDGRWVRVSISGLARLETIVSRLRTDVLREMLGKVPPMDNPIKTTIYNSTRYDYNKLDVDKLYEELMNLRKNKDWGKLFIFYDKK